jgi:hypothetical protein
MSYKVKDIYKIKDTTIQIFTETSIGPCNLRTGCATTCHAYSLPPSSGFGCTYSNAGDITINQQTPSCSYTSGSISINGGNQFSGTFKSTDPNCPNISFNATNITTVN